MTSNTIYYSFYAVDPQEIKDSSEGTFEVTLRCVLALVALLNRPLLTCLEAAFTNTTSSVCRIPSFSVLLKYSFPTLLPPFSKSQQNRRNPPPPSQRPHTSRNLPSFFTRCFPRTSLSVTVYLESWVLGTEKSDTPQKCKYTHQSHR